MTLLHQENALLIEHALHSGYRDDLDVLDTCVAESVVCHNFPEFNPSTREEFKAFFRYMADAINHLHFRINRLDADDERVRVHFHISGVHHEEFMGFPASGKQIDFHGTSAYRIKHGKIVEAWMYTSEVILSDLPAAARPWNKVRFALAGEPGLQRVEMMA